MLIKLNVKKKEYKAFLEALQFYTHINMIGEKEELDESRFVVNVEYSESEPDNLFYLGQYHIEIYQQRIKDDDDKLLK